MKKKQPDLDLFEKMVAVLYKQTVVRLKKIQIKRRDCFSLGPKNFAKWILNKHKCTVQCGWIILTVFICCGGPAGGPSAWLWLAAEGPLAWAGGRGPSPSTVTSSSPGIEDSYSKHDNVLSACTWHPYGCVIRWPRVNNSPWLPVYIVLFQSAVCVEICLRVSAEGNKINKVKGPIFCQIRV